MELNKWVLEGLIFAGDKSVVSNACFTHILQRVVGVAGGLQFDDEENGKIQSGTHKAAFAGLLTLYLEAAKHDTDYLTISSVLEDCKFDGSRISQVVKKYENHKNSIQVALSRIGRNIPYVFDVDWRQDYLIKTNNCEKVDEASYIIALKTSSDANSDITFSCTVEQLQDLVSKLKDATKCIERNASH